MKKRPLRPLKNSYPIYKQISRKSFRVNAEHNDFFCILTGAEKIYNLLHLITDILL